MGRNTNREASNFIEKFILQEYHRENKERGSDPEIKTCQQRNGLLHVGREREGQVIVGDVRGGGQQAVVVDVRREGATVILLLLVLLVLQV